ncbi:MAG TPA: methyltransferase [Sphingobacterium sp.]|jgi:tRNA1Val (adenine37-N6)-methyltransferase|nr:methyltransferase [Sphingobacterium sp.]
MGSVFRFKQFEIDQGDCAMKINTDGVLLGALAEGPDARRVLDIGTGTGVIAMMIAQRYPEASIDAVEIDEHASMQAYKNFRRSVFSERLHVIGGAFEETVPTEPYDLIVSNPPFYTNSLHNPDPRRKMAKHADNGFFERLLSFVDRNLSGNGKFQCIVPVTVADMLADILPEGLFLQEELSICSFPGEEPIRRLLSFGRAANVLRSDLFVIYAGKGVYTQRYKDILQPYFLAF